MRRRWRDARFRGSSNKRSCDPWRECHRRLLADTEWFGFGKQRRADLVDIRIGPETAQQGKQAKLPRRGSERVEQIRRNPELAGGLKNVYALACGAVGFAGCYWLPLSLTWIGAIFCGIGQGGLIAVAMTLIILRSPDAHVAARLSGMAQGFGYIIAGFGPLLAGLLRGITGSFAAPTLLFIACAAVAAWSALEAGQDKVVQVKAE